MPLVAIAIGSNHAAEKTLQVKKFFKVGRSEKWRLIDRLLYAELCIKNNTFN